MRTLRNIRGVIGDGDGRIHHHRPALVRHGSAHLRLVRSLREPRRHSGQCEQKWTDEGCDGLQIATVDTHGSSPYQLSYDYGSTLLLSFMPKVKTNPSLISRSLLPLNRDWHD
jgi:hypothetical protein